MSLPTRLATVALCVTSLLPVAALADGPRFSAGVTVSGNVGTPLCSHSEGAFHAAQPVTPDVPLAAWAPTPQAYGQWAERPSRPPPGRPAFDPVPGHYEQRTVSAWVEGRYEQRFVPEKCRQSHHSRHGREGKWRCRPAHEVRTWIPGHYEQRPQWVWVELPRPNGFGGAQR